MATPARCHRTCWCILSARSYYMPYHPVLNPNKPNKVCVMFDCTGKHQRTSLNDQLLQGPDLMNNWLVSWHAFGRNLFHQIHISPDDCDALRFLCSLSNDLSSEPEDYQMMVHFFGATSPSCANFGLRWTAVDSQQEFSVKDNRDLKIRQWQMSTTVSLSWKYLLAYFGSHYMRFPISYFKAI